MFTQAILTESEGRILVTVGDPGRPVHPELLDSDTAHVDWVGGNDRIIPVYRPAN